MLGFLGSTVTLAYMGGYSFWRACCRFSRGCSVGFWGFGFWGAGFRV